MSIKLKIALLILIIGLGAMLFVFAYLASLLPTAKRIRYEIENNPFIIKRNKEIIEMRQTNLIDK
ncbi:hypothetical protein [Pleurocapsa sp. FMAR1]|uniref:hypothetical protein n=1 Tax=Pleurocapsa sp. FMAR1 TaxID=3040204 RepID=UPI0029C65D2B|nr:hypothetical protein [Pleurocapsa sp. FMAR1]